VSHVEIEVVHAGSASRDLTDEDPRGWRLGGGVTYAALTTARLGLRSAAIVGADVEAAAADELDLLRQAGVDLLIVPLAESPVFRNVETPTGRIQTCIARGQRVPPVDLPRSWLGARAWSIVPVAAEIGDDWAPIVADGAFLAIGWQGWLRELKTGKTVERRAPTSSALLRRADLVGVSHHDLAIGTRPADLLSLLRADASLVLTDGERGGQLLRQGPGGAGEGWGYGAIEPDLELDPTGAGDTFLGALLASFVRHPAQPAAVAADPGPQLAFAAAAASLVIERPGLLGVPDLTAVEARLERRRPVAASVDDLAG
jgi:sugar/nucleoside kinase (ribokinase family)